MGAGALRALTAALAVLVPLSAAQAQPSFRSASSATAPASPAFRAAASGSYGADVRFRAAASAATSTATLTISRPTGTAANDVMIAAIGVRPATATISAPSGWTLVRRTDNTTGQTNSLAVFSKIAGASEPGSYAFVTGAVESVGGIQSFANVDTASPIDVENGQATATSLTHATPSVTTTVANAMVVSAHTFATSTTWSPPSGMTEGFDRQYQPVDTNEGQSIEGSYVLQPAAAATGTKTATAAGATGAEDKGVTHILALKPPAPILNIGLPTGTAANDVMIAAIAVRPASATISAPSGWTLVRRTDNTAGQTNSLAVYRKVAGSSEASSFAWTLTGATYAVGGIQSFMNVDTANPVDVEGGQATPTGLTHAAASVTTTVANAMLVTAHSFATSTTWTPPAGMSEAYEAQFQPLPQGQGHSIEGNYALQATAGETGIKIATASGVSGDEDKGNAQILALRPAPAVIIIAKPGGTAANDVLIAAIGVRPSTASINAPTGWTLVRRVDNNGTTAANSLAVFRRTAGSAEPADYAWDVAGAVHAVGGIQAFVNVDPANPVDVESGQATSGLTHDAPSVTTTVPNTMVVTAHTFATSTTWTAPTGMTEAFDTQFQPVATNQGQSIEGNHVLQTTGGATGAKSATASGGSGAEDIGATHTLALRPANLEPKMYFVHVDHLNTPRLVADSTGTTVWRWDQQEPFGVSVPDENPSALGAFEFPLRFPGQYADKETNLFYNYSRDYDPYLGRYQQSDPIGLTGGLNTYLYVGAMPLSKADPLGLQPNQNNMSNQGRFPSQFYTMACWNRAKAKMIEWDAQIQIAASRLTGCDKLCFMKCFFVTQSALGACPVEDQFEIFGYTPGCRRTFAVRDRPGQWFCDTGVITGKQCQTCFP
jgi:RHS repeat-associated protein